MPTQPTISDIVLSQVKEPVEQIQPSHGLIAFFDVLGYKTIVENNEVGEVASIIRETLIGKPQHLEQQLDLMRHVSSALVPEHLVFADTILVHFAIEDSEFRSLATEFFTSFCREIMARLFTNGLPLRGAIAVGDYFIQDHCFAGKPIMEAYELSNNLHLAGCALASSARAPFLTNKGSAAMFFEYPAPLKRCSKKELRKDCAMLNFRPAFNGGDLADTRSFVQKQFGAHKKPIGTDVQEKIDNTLAFFEQCRRQNPESRHAAEDDAASA